MVSDGVLEVLPLYLFVFVLELMDVMVPPTFLCQETPVMVRVEDTLHWRVIVLPLLAEYDVWETVTVGGFWVASVRDVAALCPVAALLVAKQV